MSARFAAAALIVLVAGLALHNLVMAELWEAGVRGAALDVVAAWKEALLAAALVAAFAAAGRLPHPTTVDLLALAYAAVVLCYWLLPQGWLGGEATARGELLALRHHLLPVAAYALGRLLVLGAVDRRRLEVALVAVAAVVAAWGLFDAYAISLQWWRDSGAPGWFGEQLDLTYEGLSGLPENWVLNTGDEDNPVRRLVSTLLSPLATAYLLVAVLLLLAARKPSGVVAAAGVLLYAGLLWTHTRAAYVALAGGLVVLALLTRRWWPVLAAAASLALGVAFVEAFPTIGPSTAYTREELEFLRERGAERPAESEDPLAADESSIASHWRSLRDGIETVLQDPQGFGLGNAGVTAKRTDVRIRAGESTYTELGVDTGLVGMVVFVAWCLALLVALRHRPGLCAAFAAVLALGLQSDVIGIHWLALVVFALAGLAVGETRRATAQA